MSFRGSSVLFLLLLTPLICESLNFDSKSTTLCTLVDSEPLILLAKLYGLRTAEIIDSRYISRCLLLYQSSLVSYKHLDMVLDVCHCIRLCMILIKRCGNTAQSSHNF